jgi:lysozyme family protein
MIREHEGDAFTDHPADPGGATRYGISLRYLRSLGSDLGDVDGDGDVDADDIRRMTWDEAADIFRREFWDRFAYHRLPGPVAVKVFDLAVNVGPSQACRLLQRALRSAGAPVLEDGLLGPKTVAAVWSVWRSDCPAISCAFRSEAAGFYRTLVAMRPDLSAFINGWLARAYS